MTPDADQPTVLETGEFYCSNCKSRQSYALKSSRPQAPSWLGRIFGDGDKGRYVECQNCGATAVPAVLQVADSTADADYLKGIRRVAIQMMAVDGEIADEEVAAIQEMYQQVTGHDLDDASIRREAERYSAETVDELADWLTKLAQGMNEKGKELILKTAFWVVAADSQFDESEATFIYRVGGALGVSAADVRVMMDRLG
ncbi:MAG: TerB family tellurite resistance protein [Gemmatimonadales bacterium]|jgi:uncharacterized tellurite resistance protein B-like protein